MAFEHSVAIVLHFPSSITMKSLVPLHECEPFVTKDGSLIRELLSHRNSSIRNQSLAEATVPPLTSTDAHYHPVSEEIYFILEGEATMHLGERSFTIRPGDAIAIPPGVVHWLNNTGLTPLRLLCCCAPGYEHHDTVMVESTKE
jgi:mannose-6-phosphate isomerase-like protein (cupin superfamily)